MKKSTFTLSMIASIALASTAFAISGESGPVSGSQTIDGDLTVTVSSSDTAPAISVDEGEKISMGVGSENAVITINLDGPESSGKTGLSANNGSIIEVGKVVITGDGGRMGIFANRESQITVGDNSYISVMNDGMGVGAYIGSTITIGNNVEITGNRAWGDLIYASGSGSLITIGDGAKITSDRTGESSAAQQKAINAVDGGAFMIGTDAVITNKGGGTSGLETVSVRNDSTGTIGDRAAILNSVERGYGVAVRMKNSFFTLGENSSVTTTGNSAFGVLAEDGGTIMLKAGSRVETFGNDSHGLYSYFTKLQSDYGSGSFIETQNGVTISTYGDNSWGVSTNLKNADNNETAKVLLGENNVITTEGKTSYGMLAFNDSEIKAGKGLKISTTGEGAIGAWAYGNDALIVLAENTQVKTAGDGAIGLYADLKNATIKADNGLYIQIDGNGNGAIEANRGGKIEIKDATIKINGESYAMHARSSTDDVSSISGTGVYDIFGSIFTGKNGQIDLTMQSGSIFTGATALLSDVNAQMDIKMTRSTWNIMQSSSLTGFSAEDSSRLVFTIGGAGEDEYIQVTASSFDMDGASIIEVVLDDYAAMLGDEFQLVMADAYSVSADTVFDFTRAILAGDLYWDVSDFSTRGVIRVGGEIPEPAVYAGIFGLLALALAAYRKRK